RKNKEKEKAFEKFFDEYKIRTLKVDDFSGNFRYASDLLEVDVNEIASIKITPLEYRNDLKDVENLTYEGFTNSRVYSDEYKELREYIESIEDIEIKEYHQLETWKKGNDTLRFNYKELELLLIEHQTGLEVLFKADIYRNYFRELVEELLKEFFDEILEKVLEFLEGVIEKLIDIIENHIKKKQKGKCVDRISKPDKFSLELRHITRAVKTLKIKGKKVYDQLKQALISLGEELKNKKLELSKGEELQKI
ncbi:MAG: hypothetical protein ACXAC5_19960, partial [Promethearchaeota archaeon]